MAYDQVSRITKINSNCYAYFIKIIKMERFKLVMGQEGLSKVFHKILEFFFISIIEFYYSININKIKYFTGFKEISDSNFIKSSK